MIRSQRLTPVASQENTLQTWRERILTMFLRILLIFGTPALIVNILPAIETKQFTLIAIYVLAFLLVLWLNFARQYPYSIRAGGMLLIAYIFSAIILIAFGLAGDGRIWMLFFVVFTTLLLSLRAGLVVTMISGITYTIIGYMMVHRLMEVPAGSPSSGEAAAWNSTGAVLLFLTLVIVFSLGQILEGLEKSLDSLNETLVSERQLTEELERESLELTEQSLTLERRLTQIRTAAQISSTLVKVLDPQTLMQTVVDMVKERFDLYYVGVFLVDNSGRFAILSAGTGEAGQRMLSEGHKLAVGGTSMMGWATGHGQPRIALDVGEEAIRFNNPHLPLTRSELALPLLYADQVVGGLTVQSTEPEAFDEADIAVLQQISDSLATALENARLFQQIETSLEEISNLNRQYLTSAWSEVLTRDEPTSFTYEAAGTPVLDKPPSALNIPLTLRDDQLIGNITLESERTDWSENELEFIEAVSTQAALALESARLLEETQRRVEREYALNQLTSRFSRSLDLDSLMKLVVQELGQLPKVKEVSIHIAPQDSTTTANSDGQNEANLSNRQVPEG